MFRDGALEVHLALLQSIHLGQPVIKDTRPLWSRQRWGSQSRGGPCALRAHLAMLLCAPRNRRHSTLQGT